MIIYLSGFNRLLTYKDKIDYDVFSQMSGLLSFVDMKPTYFDLVHDVKRFMLDSGAFSFIMRKLKNKQQDQIINWDEYIDNYCDFIMKHNIELFFELDVDFLVGYDKVKEFRKQIIQKTGKLPIPVWHISRGKEDFERMCDEFPYVALGGMISKENNKAVDLELMAWLVNEAHKRGTKIHGLGFTKLDYLPYVHFDSVDSTSYILSSAFGTIYYMKDGKMQKIDAPKDMITFDILKYNVKAWLNFCDYAESHF